MHMTFFRTLLTNLKKGLEKIDFSLRSESKKNKASLQSEKTIGADCQYVHQQF